MALFEETELWRSGDEGLETYYVYGLATARGVLHVFAEGRVERHDRSPHHIAHRRSFDAGRTWEATSFVAVSSYGECYANPVPAATDIGDLVLLYARNLDNNSSELFSVRSSDDAATWSPPRSLTHLFEGDRFGRTLHLPGPGHGIQQRSGRLIFPIWHRRECSLPPKDRCYGISFIASDDGGISFTPLGEIDPGPEMLNESRVAEFDDGTLMVNARSGAFVESLRYQVVSSDGGITWSKPTPCTGIGSAFATDSSFLPLPGGELLFMRPDGTERRECLTAYTSTDRGARWRRQRTIFPGPAGYSDAIVLEDGTIGLVYGRELLADDGSVEGNAKRTMFARFGLEWLMEDTYER